MSFAHAFRYDVNLYATIYVQTTRKPLPLPIKFVKLLAISP